MDNSKTSFDEHAALKLIEDTIQQAKNHLGEDGFIFLLWGWIVMLGSVSSFLTIHYGYQTYLGWCWLITCTAGGVISGMYYRKKLLKEGRSRITQLIGYVWGATGIGAGIFYVYLIVNGPQELINPFVLTAVGIATFATGRILRFMPMIIGGAFFWLFAIVTMIIHNELQFLVSATAMIPGYLIPGYLLRALYKKQNV